MLGRIAVCVSLALVPCIVRLYRCPVPAELEFFRNYWVVEPNLFTAAKSFLQVFCGGLGFLYLLGARWWRFFDVYLVGYLSLLALSVIFSKLPELSLWGFPTQHEGFLILLSYPVLYLAQLVSFQTPAYRKWLNGSLYFSCTAVVFLGVCQLSGVDIFQLPGIVTLVFGSIEEAQKFKLIGKSTFSTLMNPDFLGQYAAMMFPFLLGRFGQSVRRQDRGFLGILLILTGLVGFRSASRGGVLATFVATGFVLYWARHRFTRKKGLFPVIAVAIAVSIMLALPGSRPVWQRFSSSLSAIVFQNAQNATAQVAIRHLSVRDGRALIVTKDFDLRVDGAQAELHFSHLDGQPVAVEIVENRLLFKDAQYRNLNASLDFHLGRFGRVLNLDYDGFRIPLVMVKDQVKLLAWNSPLDSSPSRKVNLWANDKLGGGRIFLWSRVLPLLQSRFLLGSGPGTLAVYFPQTDFYGKYLAGFTVDTAVDRPHNFFLEIAFGSGVLSLIFLLIFIGRLLKRGLKLAKQEPAIVPSLAAAVGFLVAGLFSDSYVGITPIFWAHLAMIGSYLLPFRVSSHSG